jgi:hypothetical protein
MDGYEIFPYGLLLALAEPLPETALQPAVIGNQTDNIAGNWAAWVFDQLLGSGLPGLPEYAHLYPQNVTHVPGLSYPYAPITTGGTAISGGYHQLFQMTNSPTCNIVGTGGSQPCVSVIIQHPGENNCPAGGVFHFYPSNDVAATITQYNWPQGSHAVIAGGDNSASSAAAFWDVMGTLNKLNIPFQIVNSSSIYLAPDGNWYMQHSMIGYDAMNGR